MLSQPTTKTHKYTLLGLCLLAFFCQSCSARNYLRNYPKLDSPRYASPNSVTAHTTAQEQFKVVTFNIKYAKKITEAITLLQTNEHLVNADVVLLQEMDLVGVIEIAKALDYNYVYYPAVIHPINKKDFGNAVLSKWPVLRDQKIILPNFDLQARQRIAVGTVLQVEDKIVEVFSVHMGLFAKPSERKRRAQTILDHKDAAASYSIVGGDFNTFTKDDHQEIYASFVSAGYQYATADLGWTHRHWYSPFRNAVVDHVYTKGFDIIEQGKVEDQSASDHLPLWVDLKW